MRSIHDPNVPASLLKFWLRDLADPLIPTEMYDDSLTTLGNISTIMQQIVERLPDVNRRVVEYMVGFLRVSLSALIG